MEKERNQPSQSHSEEGAAVGVMVDAGVVEWEKTSLL
jgi:hypothetical protein